MNTVAEFLASSDLLEDEQNAINWLVAVHQVHWATQDDSDERALVDLVHSVSQLNDSVEVWADGDVITVYQEGPIFRLCISDIGGSYNLYFWAQHNMSFWRNEQGEVK